jgi:hypothetical protein
MLAIAQKELTEIFNLFVTGINEVIDEVISDDPSFIAYSIFPQTGGNYQHYDLKDRGNEARKGVEKLKHYYRGSVDADGEIGSARDFGNIGAGILAGRSGMPYLLSRKGFDLYNGSPEPPTTVLSQKLGFKIGQELIKSDLYNLKKTYGF